MQRRDFLTTTAGAGACALAGCLGTNTRPLDVTIYQTGSLARRGELVRDDPLHAARVAKRWVEYTYRPLPSVSELDSLSISIAEQPVDLDLKRTSIALRQTEWNGYVNGSAQTAEHANILLDLGPPLRESGTIGLAFLLDSQLQCRPGGQSTDSSIVQYADDLLSIDLDTTPHPIEIVADQELVDDFRTGFVASSVAHEIGHNLCTLHNAGNAWRGGDVPSQFDVTPDPDTVYTSMMMAMYVTQLGEGSTACGDDIATFDYDSNDTTGQITFYDDLTVLPDASMCALTEMGRHLAQD